VLGKAAGVDLLEGKLTLPLIYLLESYPSARQMIQTIMIEGEYRTFQREELLGMVEREGALERAHQRARFYAEAARDALSALPASKFIDALRSIPVYIVERDR
jgi:octaprenyl-diphosphate synthase